MHYSRISRGIYKLYRENLRDRINCQVKFRDFDEDWKLLLAHFGITDILYISNEEVRARILDSLSLLLVRKHLLSEMLANKLARNSIDVTFMYN